MKFSLDTVIYPKEVLNCLTGKRLAMIGFEREEVRRLQEALADLQVSTRDFTDTEAPPGSPKLRPFDLLIIHVPDLLDGFVWLNANSAADNDKPLLFFGRSDLLLQQVPLIPLRQYDFLSLPWHAEEVVLRIYHIFAASEQAKLASTNLADAANAGKVRVLVADDDPTIVALVKAVLAKEDVECLIAKNGSVAVNMIKTLHPHAVILDINMPLLDGFEVLNVIKNDDQTRDIPVLMLTSLQQENDIVRVFDLGADEYISKPFRPLELAARLQKLLKRPAVAV